MIRKLASHLFLLLIAGGLLAGCNTMEGLGEDIEEAGDSLEEEAEEND